MARPVVPRGPMTDAAGYPTSAWLEFFTNLDLGNTSTITSIVSGVAAAQASADAANQSAAALGSGLTQESAQRAAGDAAGQGAGDGTGTSDSEAWTSPTVTDSSWVVASSLTITSTGAGDYTFSPPISGVPTNAGLSSGSSFAGLWRIVEELTAGGTEHVLDNGTFTIETTPIGDGLGSFTVITYTGLPSSPIAANETSSQVDLRFELSRASGSNTLSGLTGSFGVSWA